MSSKLQHTLLNLEIAPPQASWDAIAIRLDEEYDEHETIVSGKLDNWEATPPAKAWQNIVAGLSEDIPVERKQPAPVFSFRKLAIAAAITGILVLAGWYFFTGTSAPADVLPTDAGSASTEATAQPPVSNNLPVVPSTVVASATKERPLTRRKQYAEIFKPAINEPDNNYQLASFIPHSNLDDVRSIPINKEPNVEAPLIRDRATGRIILDERLITSSDNNYIIVTAPNGEQTRISARFLQMLGSMNEDIKPSDYFDYFFMGENNSGWKIRFNEWRNKLLRQASFIPTATNFLDILELKDILQDGQ